MQRPARGLGSGASPSPGRSPTLRRAELALQRQRTSRLAEQLMEGFAEELREHELNHQQTQALLQQARGPRRAWETLPPCWSANPPSDLAPRRL